MEVSALLEKCLRLLAEESRLDWGQVGYMILGAVQLTVIRPELMATFQAVVRLLQVEAFDLATGSLPVGFLCRTETEAE